uniref:C2H2-type domain-containing protein n=2 Tax=Clastoptera arizonana TaxID=38151 RepID=A0A1B6CSE8_9HEMI
MLHNKEIDWADEAHENQQLSVSPHFQNCFICNECLKSNTKYNLVLCKVKHSESQVAEVLGSLVGDDFAVFVSEDDCLCDKCMELLNLMDKLECDFFKVRNKLIELLKINYELTSSDEVIPDEEKKEISDERVIKVDDEVKKEDKLKPNSLDKQNSFKCYICKKNIIGEESFILHLKLDHSIDYNVSKFKNVQVIDNDNAKSKHEISHSYELCANDHKTDQRQIAEDDSLHKPCINLLSVNNIEETDELMDILQDREINIIMGNVNESDVRVKNLDDSINTNNDKCNLIPPSSEGIESVDMKIVMNDINTELYSEIVGALSDQYTNSWEDVDQSPEDPTISDDKCNFNDEFISVDQGHVCNDQHQKPFKCQYCSLSFSKKYILSFHILKLHKFTHFGFCIFCRKVFLDKNQLNFHVEKDHLDLQERPHCMYCRNTYSTDTDLKIHILKEHFNDNNVNYSGNISILVDSQTNTNFEKDDLKNKLITHNNFLIDKEDDFDLKSHEEYDFNIYCAMCDFSTRSSLEMEQHVVKHQTKENNFCKICVQFFGDKEFTKHLNHSNVTQSLPCKFCKHYFHDAVHLKWHIKRTHHKLEIQTCKYCDKVYTDLTAFEKHIKTKHIGDNNERSCEVCKISFRCEKSYSIHVEYAHRTSLKCKICGKEIKTLKKLQCHEMIHVRDSNTVYKCDICNKVLKTRTGLRFHKIRHTGNYPFVCEFCGQGFVSTHALTEHFGHHVKEKRYMCDVCGKGFCYYDTMYRHRVLHDNPYPKICSICKKGFRNSSRLAIHRRREHTGERPYKCTYCPRTFFTSNGYKHHLCLHTKKFPYNCKPCHKGFTTRNKYAIHLSRKHNDESLLINRAPNNKEWNELWKK